MEHQTGKLINSFDHKNNYKELTKKKIKVCFFTYRPMWNLAKDLSKKLYGNMKGNHGASTIINVALSNFLEKHGFKKYNLAIKLSNLIKSRTYLIYFDKVSGAINLVFNNLVFEPDNKVYNDNIIIQLNEFIDYQNINIKQILTKPDQINFSDVKKLLIIQHNHIGILERKIKLLEEKINSLETKDYYDSDYDYGKN